MKNHWYSFNFPVLKGKEDNLILRISILSDSVQQTVEAIKINAGNIKNMKSVRVLYTGLDSLFNTKKEFGKSQSPSEGMVFEEEQNLERGQNCFRFSFSIRCKIFTVG